MLSSLIALADDIGAGWVLRWPLFAAERRQYLPAAAYFFIYLRFAAFHYIDIWHWYWPYWLLIVFALSLSLLPLPFSLFWLATCHYADITPRPFHYCRWAATLTHLLQFISFDILIILFHYYYASDIIRYYINIRLIDCHYYHIITLLTAFFRLVIRFLRRYLFLRCFDRLAALFSSLVAFRHFHIISLLLLFHFPSE